MTKVTITKQRKARAFQRTMQQARSHMNPVARTFSTFIHLKAIDQFSRLLSATVARPLALLCGALGMVVVVAIMYGTAKTIGYTLSGSEGLIGFAIGWIIGIAIDFFHLMATGGRKKR